MAHILIIEDDLLVALDIQDCAEDIGAQTTAVAASEESAVKLALERRPDFIISDVRLAEGTGPEAVRRISEHHGPIPVLYITGNPEAVRNVDPDAPLLVKPFRREQVKEEVGRLGLASVLI